MYFDRNLSVIVFIVWSQNGGVTLLKVKKIMAILCRFPILTFEQLGRFSRNFAGTVCHHAELFNYVQIVWRARNPCERAMG
jgi:hypothetical protein